MFPYIPITQKDKEEMLTQIGADSLEELFSDIPEDLRLKRELELPERMSEMELRNHFLNLSKRNGTDFLCFRGAGAYEHYIPSVVRHLVLRSEFYTAYTPYQPEISQGMLQAIFEYQTMICELTGMDVSNASVYDGAAAAAEAAFIAVNVTGRNKVLVSSTVNPEIRKVIKTYCKVQGVEVVELGWAEGITDVSDLKSKMDNQASALIIQSPNFFGCIEPCTELFEITHNAGAVAIMSVEPVSLGMLKPPGELGADIAVGDGQSLGNPLSFGGPYAGFMAAREKFVRRLPGRIVGQTVDKEGKRGFVLTLQAREQHIRREKAASNICSNQALNALAVVVYLSAMGKKGFKHAGDLCFHKAHYAADKITDINGYSTPFNKPFFNEFVVKCERPVKEINDILLKNKIIGGYNLEKDYPELKNHLLFCVTETKTKEDIDKLVKILTGDSSLSE